MSFFRTCRAGASMPRVGVRRILRGHSALPRRLPRVGSAVALCLLGLYALGARPGHAAAAPAAVEDRSRAGLQHLVDDLRTRLAIPEEVAVNVVERNPHIVSVAPSHDAEHTFRLDVERDFSEQLTDEELSAAVAHELGHVWIFTHHPYLQTERLANDIAMRVVSRDSLKRVYAKAWAHDGTKGDLVTFLGS